VVRAGLFECAFYYPSYKDVALPVSRAGRSFLMHARIGMLRALNCGKPKAATTAKPKAAKAYRIVR
jgi:hypothetical protein